MQSELSYQETSQFVAQPSVEVVVVEGQMATPLDQSPSTECLLHFQ